MLILLTIVYTLLLWWASTGVIMFLYRRPHLFRATFLIATGLLSLAMMGLVLVRADTRVVGAYLGFLCGTVVYGWQLVAFYLGFLTGPRRQGCDPGVRGWRRFVQSLAMTLHHELVALFFAAAIVVLLWDAPNQVGMWTYLLMWLMHQSAKLNIYFGVRSFDESSLPEHLHFLRGAFPKRRFNLFFPISLTIAVISMIWIVQQLLVAVDRFLIVQATMMGFLMLLAILEHVLLMTPDPRVLFGARVKAQPIKLFPGSLNETIDSE